MFKNKTRQLTIDAMLAAMCAVLGYLAIDVTSLKITFESVPVLIGALLFGPVDGAMIGLIGTLIYQLLKYGVSATTVLWIAPYVLCGLIVGAFAKLRRFQFSQTQMLVLVVLAELMVTVLNTGVIYVDSKLYGYYYPAIITGNLALRLVICVGKAVAYALVLPPLLKILRKRSVTA